MAVVSVLNARMSHDQLLMHLLRCLTFFAAYFRFEIKASHTPGVLNTAADANNIPLSRPTDPTNPRATNTGGSTSHAPPRLGLTSLDPLVDELFEQGITPATRATYQSGWHQYLR